MSKHFSVSTVDDTSMIHSKELIFEMRSVEMEEI
jgi:hypothetical protein